MNEHDRELLLEMLNARLVFNKAELTTLNKLMEELKDERVRGVIVDMIEDVKNGINWATMAITLLKVTPCE